MYYNRNSPRYQRAVQKLQGLPQEVRAILNVSALDPILEQEAQTRLAFRKLATDSAMREKELASREQYRGRAYQLQQKGAKWDKKQALWSNVLAGIGVPIAGLSGYFGMKERQRLADAYRNALTGRV